VAERGRNRALLAWYQEHRRSLPWRNSSDPWWILVSEVMAQQTQVTRVAPVFERFIVRFPTPRVLAESPADEVISAWEGLGYLRRALALREAAARIADDGWPRDPEGLERLPGVGPYTASAVACFAFGHAVPAVDVNLRRVLSRWTGRALCVEEARGMGAELLDADHPAEWNQAVMDLAAAHCRPRNPGCDACPVASWCVDPSIEIGSRRQSPFEGSVRQARAAILKTLAAEGPVGVKGLAASLGLAEDRVARAVSDLVGEGIVSEAGGMLRLDGQD
jgi:A/G-specific adenine glycosylase